MAEKWSSGIRTQRGGLGGWHESQSAETRHRHLREVARKDGPAEVSRRLNFLANIYDRKTNSELGRVAREDQRWVESDLEDERPRPGSEGRGGPKPIRVRESSRARGHRRRRAR